MSDDSFEGEEVSKVFQGYFKIKEVSGVFWDCFKEVQSISKVFQGRFVLLLLLSQLPEQKEGLFVYISTHRSTTFQNKNSE